MNVFIMSDALTNFTVTSNQVANAFGNIVDSKNFSYNFLTSNGTQRCFFRWLPHAYIAANPSQCYVPTPHGYGKIKSGDNGYDTQRMPLLVHAMSRTFALHGKSMQLP